MNHDATIELRFAHRVRFTDRAFEPANATLAQCFEPRTPALSAAKAGLTPADAPRVLCCLDANLADAQPGLPDALDRYAREHGLELADDCVQVPGGERCKNDPAIVDHVLAAIERAGLDRHSYVLAVGGGAVLDVVGFAAAIAHRGVRLVRVCTTTLSQCDSGVGVKTGVNRFGQKNYLGTFSVPWAVVNDRAMLATLGDRDWRSGFSEVVKVALLKDADLFEKACEAAPAIAARDLEATWPLLVRAAELHLEHIVCGGDPFELGASRPLDFGHWAAHKLETLTDFELTHGEAVAIGVALDVTYAEHTGLLDAAIAGRVRGCLRGMGFALHHQACDDAPALLAGLEEFRAHLGGRLAVPMIADVARPVEVDAVDAAALRDAIARLADEH